MGKMERGRDEEKGKGIKALTLTLLTWKIR
jgi:hypothetical protein